MKYVNVFYKLKCNMLNNSEPVFQGYVSTLYMRNICVVSRVKASL